MFICALKNLSVYKIKSLKVAIYKRWIFKYEIFEERLIYCFSYGTLLSWLENMIGTIYYIFQNFCKKVTVYLYNLCII